MDKTLLTAHLTACGIHVDDLCAERICRYHALLMDWNTRMDLTAVTEEAEMIDKHYVDSLIARKDEEFSRYFRKFKEKYSLD